MTNTADKANRQPANRDEIIQLIKDHDEWAIGALLKLYSFQTPDEQQDGYTRYDNSMGFSGIDSDILSSIATQFINKGWLSPKQTDFVRRAVQKYTGQLLDGFPPAELKKPEVSHQKKFQRVLKDASLAQNGTNIIIKFGFPKGQNNEFYETLKNIKSLPGRRFLKKSESWTAPLSMDSIQSLKEWGFNLSDTLKRWLKEITAPVMKKLVLDFSLCPLYKGLGIIFNEKEKSNAKWSVSENAKSIKSSKSKSGQRQTTKSQSQSNIQIKTNCQKPRMENQGVKSDNKSDELPRNSKTTSRRIRPSAEKTRNQFQRWQRTRINSNYKISRQIIISMWLQKGISNQDKTCEEYFQKCSACIQSRFCKPRTNDSNRTRWTDSPINGSKENRQKENENAGSPWMECNTLASLQSMIMIPGLQKGLYGFQSEGVIFIDARKGNSIIADQMGTGKTVQALAYLQLHPELRPAVVVVPASVKLNWAREAEKWMTDPAVKVLSGKTPYKLNPSNPYIYIINYDILRNETEMKPKIDKKTGLTVINPATGKPKMEKVEIRNTGWGDFLSKISPRIMIVDECQFIKNKKALQTKAVLRVGKTAGRVIGLSGTPIVNRPVEFYNIIDLVKPNLIGSFWDYARTYCGATHNGFGWDFGGATNMKKLHQILSSTIMIRRKKSEVLKDLPAKTRTVVPLEIDNRADYQKAANDIIGWIEDNVGEDAAAKAKHAEILVQFEKLKQLAVKGKMKMAIQWIKDFIDTGEKLVVFATHKIVIDELMKKFGNIAVKIDGSTLVKKRLAIIDQFQEDPNTKLFVGNMKAAGAGITLTAAFNAVILELGWTPGEHDQAEDRIHRIGQENAANIWYLIADDTIENEIATLLDDKRKVLTAILDGEDVKDESILTKLIESVRGDKQ